MRILHILDHGLPLHSGYSFRTRAIMKAQAAAGLEVAGLTGIRHIGAACDPGAPSSEEIEGLRFFRTPAIASAPPVVAELREVNALADRLAEVIAEWKPDVLHAHSPVLNALAAQRIAKRFGLPLVYEIRAFWEDAAVANGTGTAGSPRYRLTRWLETRACRKADAVAVICEGLRADLVTRGIDAAKILVSPNGVDLDLFGGPPARDDALAWELGLSEQADVIGFIGSFYDYEGIDDLIAAMPALVAERPNAELLLVGGGPQDAALQAQAKASPVAAHIHFVGRVPHDEVERYYGLVDILAYPRKAMRLTETVTPLKPLEAMAQRRLVAASDVGGHRELIEHDVTGTLFPPDDPQAIAAALGDMLASRGDWEMRRDAGRAFIERDRDWATNVSRYSRLYRSLVRNDPASAMPAESRRVARSGMSKNAWLRRLSDAPIEAPLGIALGGALGFALLAMPQPLFEALVRGSGLPALTTSADAPIGLGFRLGAVTILAIAAALATWALLCLAGGGTIRRRRPTRRDVPKVRRADAHPDAPTRLPIYAARDLGAPMMDVSIAERPRIARIAAIDSPPPAPQAVAVAPTAPAVRHDEVLELTPLFAVTPDDDRVAAMQPVPAPAILTLVERLKAGLERRSAAGVPIAPADGADPALREALATLGLLAARQN